MLLDGNSYIASPKINFPILGLEWKIDGVSVVCKKCEKELPQERIRGYEYHYENCIAIKCAAPCHDCKLITNVHMRFYRDGRISLKTDNGWEERNIHEYSILNKISQILLFLKKILTF